MINPDSNHGRRLDKVDKEIIRILITYGYPFKTITTIVGCSKRTVCYWKVKLGLNYPYRIHGQGWRVYNTIKKLAEG